VALRRTSRSHAAPRPYDNDDAPEPSRLRCECRDRGEDEEEPESEAGAAERLKEWQGRVVHGEEDDERERGEHGGPEEQVRRRRHELLGSRRAPQQHRVPLQLDALGGHVHHAGRHPLLLLCCCCCCALRWSGVEGVRWGWCFGDAKWGASESVRLIA
jgi:hypothetical protein